MIPDSERNGHISEDGIEDIEVDDDGENVISLDKIKASASLQDNEKEDSDDDDGHSDVSPNNVKIVADLQLCFQPGSTPSHLLSYYMVWCNNNVSTLVDVFVKSLDDVHRYGTTWGWFVVSRWTTRKTAASRWSFTTLRFIAACILTIT